MTLPNAVTSLLEEAEIMLAEHPKLLAMFKNCYPNTLETTTKIMNDNTAFVFTGDIPGNVVKGFQCAGKALYTAHGRRRRTAGYSGGVDSQTNRLYSYRPLCECVQ